MRPGPILLIALALPACGSGGSKVDYHANGGQTITVDDPKTGKMQAELGASAKMPGDLPAWTPAYPGSTVLVSQQHEQNGKPGAYENVMLQTPDPVAKVSAFYDQQLLKAGVKSMHSITDAEASIRMIELPTEMIGVNVTKSEEGGSSISISRLPK